MDRKRRDKSGPIIRPGCKRKKMATGLKFKYQSLRCIILLFKNGNMLTLILILVILAVYHLSLPVK